MSATSLRNFVDGSSPDTRLLCKLAQGTARRYMVGSGVILAVSPLVYTIVKVVSRKHHVSLVEAAARMSSQASHVEVNADDVDEEEELTTQAEQPQQPRRKNFIRVNGDKRSTSSGSIFVSYQQQQDLASKAYRVALGNAHTLKPVLRVVLKHQHSSSAEFSGAVAASCTSLFVTRMLTRFCKQVVRDMAVHAGMFAICEGLSRVIPLVCQAGAGGTATTNASTGNGPRSFTVVAATVSACRVVGVLLARLAKGGMEVPSDAAVLHPQSFFALYDFAWSAYAPSERCLLPWQLPRRFLRFVQVHIWRGRPSSSEWVDTAAADHVWRALNPAGYMYCWLLRDATKLVSAAWESVWERMWAWVRPEGGSAASAPSSISPSLVNDKRRAPTAPRRPWQRLLVSATRNRYVRCVSIALGHFKGSFVAYAVLSIVSTSASSAQVLAPWSAGGGICFHLVGYGTLLFEAVRCARLKL